MYRVCTPREVAYGDARRDVVIGPQQEHVVRVPGQCGRDASLVVADNLNTTEQGLSPRRLAPGDLFAPSATSQWKI